MTWTRNLYQVLGLYSTYRVVSFSEASAPSRLERPVTPPPQPPLIEGDERRADGERGGGEEVGAVDTTGLVGEFIVRGRQVFARRDDAGHRSAFGHDEGAAFDFDLGRAREVGFFPAVEGLAVEEGEGLRLRFSARRRRGEQPEGTRHRGRIGVGFAWSRRSRLVVSFRVFERFRYHRTTLS